MSRENKEALIRYFELFDGIYSYCDQVYGVGEGLTDALVVSGGKPLDGAKRVQEYIDLAKRFWKEHAESGRGQRAIAAMFKKM